VTGVWSEKKTSWKHLFRKRQRKASARTEIEFHSVILDVVPGGKRKRKPAAGKSQKSIRTTVKEKGNGCELAGLGGVIGERLS